MTLLKQLTFDLGYRKAFDFNNFVAGKNNQLVKALKDLHLEIEPALLYFWGERKVGKTHLLTALSKSFGEAGLSFWYLPLEEHKQLKPEILKGLEVVDLLMIDNLELIAEVIGWEEPLLHAFNNFIAHRKKMVISSRFAPWQLNFKLKDLLSRLNSGLVFKVEPLNDSEKLKALRLHAIQHGFELTDEVGFFLLNHYNRDFKFLLEMLAKLDKASLSAKRKITIPFIKQVFKEDYGDGI